MRVLSFACLWWLSLGGDAAAAAAAADHPLPEAPGLEGDAARDEGGADDEGSEGGDPTHEGPEAPEAEGPVPTGAAERLAARNRRFVLVPTWRTGPASLGSDRTIGPAEISTLPRRSAEDLLRLVPGMLIVQHGSQGKGFQLYLRGFDAAHGSDVEVRLEDIPLNERSNVHGHGYLDLAFIIPEVVSSVSVQKGAYRLEQGDFATAGTVDYRLGVAAPDRGLRTTYEVGTTNRHRLATVLAPKDRPEGSFLAVEALSDAGYGQNRGAQRLGTMGQTRLWSGPNETEVDLLLAGYAARFGLPGALRSSDLERGAADFYDSYTDEGGGSSFRGLSALRVHGHPGRHALEGRIYGGYRRLSLDENFTGYLIDPERGDRRLQTHDAATVGTRLAWSYRPHDTVQLRAITTYQLDGIDQAERGLTEAGDPFETRRQLTGRQHHLAAGPGLRWVPRPWARFDLGLRADLFADEVDDQDGAASALYGALSPRLTVALDAGSDWSFFGAYGRGLRSPEARAATRGGVTPPRGTFEQFDGGRARVTLSDDAELGVRWMPHPAVEVGATGFGVWIARESVFDHVSGFNVERNATRRLGSEAWIFARPAPWVLLGVDATYTDARFVESGNPVPGAPRWMGAVQGSLLHPIGARAGMRWSLLGPRPLAYGAVAGGYTVMDLSLGWRWRRLQVDGAIDNLFASQWREGEYHYASYWDRSRPRSSLPAVHYVAGYPINARLTLTGFF